jgi:hypothetical protein
MVCRPEVTMLRDRRVSLNGLLPGVLLLSALFLASVPSGARAQVLDIGANVAVPNSVDVPVAEVRTDIDLTTPATATGTLDTATFQWSDLGCMGAVKLKFFRRQVDTLVFLEERGPFDSTGTPTQVTLSPPVQVQEGDLIGIARVANCGNPATLSGIVSAGYVSYSGDLTGDVSLSAAQATSGDTLAVHATGTAVESVARVLPAAASTPGNFGSFFKTSVQMFNPWSNALSGRFVYHPAGVPGSSSDPILTFTIGVGQSVSYPDIVGTMGATGLGSIDIVMSQPNQPPVIVARVFNDAGAAGTSGFTEDAVSPDGGNGETALMFAGSTGFLIAPTDTAHFRFNMGVRTFLSGAFITLKVHDATGAVVHTVTKTYQPTYFEQQPSDTFLGYTLQPNDVIEVNVSGGSAVIYGATTDNTTNDPSIQYARVVFAVL